MALIKKMSAHFAGCLIAVLWLTTNGVAASLPLPHLIQDAMKVLALEKNSEDLGVLTNARYVLLDGKSTAHYITDIETLTGCSMGRGNLLFFNERPKNALLIVLAHRTNRQCVVIRYDGNKGESKMLSLNHKDIRDPEFFWNATPGASGKETFPIVSILNAWFAGAPYDFLQSAELHGHVCPGLFLGYITAKGVLEKYPLLDGEKYIFIASPNECKDDAIQMLLGVTAGKRNLIVTSVDKKVLQKKVEKKIVGIVIKWSEGKNTGLGAVLSIDVDALKAAAKVEMGPHMSRTLSLMATKGLLAHISDYDDFFSIEKEFPVTRELKEEFMRAGTNPYVNLGLMPASN